MNKWRVENYNAVKQTFNTFVQNNNQNEFICTMKENRDTLALNLNIQYKAKYLDFFYIFGNTQVIEAEGTSDSYYVAPINPNSLLIHIQFQVEDYLKKWKKEEQCA